MPTFIDNVTVTLNDELKSTLRTRGRLSIAAASFSIYAYEALKKELENIEELHFLFTKPTFTKTDAVKNGKEQREFYIPKLNRERSLYGTEFEIKLRNQLSQKAIAKECADWIRRKVKFKTNVSDQVVHAGSIVVSDPAGEKTAFTPINDFSKTELGLEKGNYMGFGINKIEAPISNNFLASFNRIWNDNEKLQDITDTILESIENVYRENSPDYIYFVTLYNIFHEFLDNISEDDLANEATGFKNSAIWNKLYDFQKEASLAIINKLEKFNGCILADSVGLGKTFTALSVIKYYENKNRNVLVLCPKKLRDNWLTYRENYKNNPVASDRFAYRVMNHSDLSRTSGYSGDIDIARFNWSNYELIVIDESHNFRNGGKTTDMGDDEDPKENRYLQLMNKVIRQGVRTKVLMLSATPVNNRFNDLKNQLELAYEGDSSQLEQAIGTGDRTIADIFKQAQSAYSKWSELEESERTTQRLLGMLSFDFFKILDSVTIARSRKHIEKFYDTSKIGTFPERLKPIARRPGITDIDSAVTFRAIFDLLQQLKLVVYSPSAYILPSRLYKYEDDAPTKAGGKGLSLINRERGIRVLMQVQLLKRLESSIYSFNTSLGHVKRFMEHILQKLRNHVADLEINDIDGLGLDEDEITVGRENNRIHLDDLDYKSWERDLNADCETITKLIEMISIVTPEHDSKLQQLLADIDNKIEHPFNNDNRKVIVFSAFSDTAEYLYNNVAEHVLKKYGLHSALVTGDVNGRTTLKTKRKMDFNMALTLFSPISKEKQAIYPEIKENIDILIATDCISEGQNLQDCDYLVNYDIHWNPVRIIQRFGRIDRIGSKNKSIQLVNFWPDIELDEYINLQGRVESRMKAVVMTSTGDDNPIAPEEPGDLDYRRDQLKRLHDEVVDLEEMNKGVSIMDLGLNEFRQDLIEYMKDNPDIDHTPHGLHAVVAKTANLPEGVIFVLKNKTGEINIGKKNRLHPFYMVYLDNDGNVITNHLAPKDLLDNVRALSKGKVEPLKDLCKAFNKETADGKRMDRYSKLLDKAVESIVDVRKESAIDSFLGGDQGELFDKVPAGLDDFELISFFVVK